VRDSDVRPCARCGRIVHTGEAKIAVPMQVSEAAELAYATNDDKMRERLLCAIGLLDPGLEKQVRDDIAQSRA